MTFSDVVVESPFASGDEGDVVLRTSDGKSFHVFKNILSLVSPVFRDMFGLVQLGDVQQLPVVDIPEDSYVINCLLRICYPVANPTFSTPEEIDACLRVAHKYDMEHCTRCLGDALENFSLCVGIDVMTIAFAVSCRWDIDNIAQRCASGLAYRITKPALPTAGPLRAASPMSTAHPGQMAAAFYQKSLADTPAGSFHRLLRVGYAVATDSYAVPVVCSKTYCSPEGPREAIPFLPPKRRSRPDLVVKSCDGISFDAHRDVVVKASNMLEGTDALAPGSGSVNIALDSTILAPLLHLCYSRCTFYAELRPMHAETVYLMALRFRVARAQDFMVKWLHADMPSNPTRVYLIAARLGFEDVAREAALVATRRNTVFVYDEQMEYTETRHYVALLEYSYAYQEAFLKGVADKKRVEAARNGWEAVCNVLGADDDEGPTEGVEEALAFVQAGMKPTRNPKKTPPSRSGKGTVTRSRSKKLQAAKNSSKQKDKSNRVKQALISLRKVKLSFAA
ncbi:hypothetical protein EUX98_g8286 [Antrodiella citrinella]|uniref:BTB domain-containing protein n=1 Tax=Antrodiella citrinella TaxID=2447956 RepID=A0A4S4M9D1_9APHY|nr:hypothetical protein EUX98_g8286 [Antrodiella citrinella]